MSSPSRVLLVEDHPAATRVLLVMLGGNAGRHPFRVSHAGSLHEARDTLRTDGPFDAVVLDLDLPDCDGLDTYRVVREAAPDAAVVVLSDTTDASTARAAVDAGAQDLLAKPGLDAEDLVRTVELAVARQTSRTAVARAMRSADDANARLQELVDRASRELLGPVATVTALADALVTDWDQLPSEARRLQVDRIARAAARLARGGSHVLHNAAAESGTSAPRPTAVHPAELIADLVADLDLADVELHVDPDVAIHVDALDADAVLGTLLRNAARQRGGRVVVDAERHDGMLLIGVADHGPTVPAASAGDLFHRTTRRGLGSSGRERRDLFVARRMARANDGDLVHDPSWTHGARFVLTLPLADSADEDADRVGTPVSHAAAA